MPETPEMQRVKRNQKNVSTVLHLESSTEPSLHISLRIWLDSSLDFHFNPVPFPKRCFFPFAVFSSLVPRVCVIKLVVLLTCGNQLLGWVRARSYQDFSEDLRCQSLDLKKGPYLVLHCTFLNIAYISVIIVAGTSLLLQTRMRDIKTWEQIADKCVIVFEILFLTKCPENVWTLVIPHTQFQFRRRHTLLWMQWFETGSHKWITSPHPSLSRFND